MSEIQYGEKAKVICCSPADYLLLLHLFNDEGTEKKYKIITEFKSVQLVQEIGNLQLQPKIIHVIFYKYPIIPTLHI